MPRTLKRLEPIEITGEAAEELARQEEQADIDSHPETGSTMIAIRWGNQQLRRVRQAAEARGVPYQVYIRNAAWELAMRDLEREQALAAKG